jgi:hypothetical protein
MATINPSWTENQSLTGFDDTSPADTVTAKTTLDIDNAGPYDCVVVQLKITWHASATDYANISVYASPDSGTTSDTIAIWSQQVDADAGETTYISFVLQDIPFVNIWVENQSNQEIAEVSGNYSGRKWSSE